jgi:NADH:ubiquinone oxidoreductase subunit 3 (subunit A)
VRSARNLLAVLLACCVAIVAAIFLLFVGEWLAAAVLGGVSLVAYAAGAVSLRKVDKAELQAISDRNQRLLEVWARSVGRSSGGWN